jgi:acetyltransferase
MSDVVSIETSSNASRDVVQSTRHPLDYIFTPGSVAVIGATEAAGSVGRTVLSNLLKSPFGGPVYPVNPKRRSVLGVPCSPNLKAIQERVDLAVIVTPAKVVPGVIEECIGSHVGAANCYFGRLQRSRPGPARSWSARSSNRRRRANLSWSAPTVSA